MSERFLGGDDAYGFGYKGWDDIPDCELPDDAEEDDDDQHPTAP